MSTDPISLEVLRHRLEAITQEGAAAIERTAISPVVTESRDYSCTLLEPDGGLILGGGKIDYHFHAASNAVAATVAAHGDTLAPGDVFMGNDPHNGGGLHAQDVMVQRPLFADGELLAWIVNSAHLMDMGGMMLGSWAPGATECYQEALRFPPIRLFAAGIEQADVWAIFRNNVRLSTLVEMDMRSLVAGCHVAHEKLAGVIADWGAEPFGASVRALADLSRDELRRRIGQIEDGTYRAVSWTEWEDELFEVPCTLTVAGEGLHFDFEGASPQADHFFNSKPYIIASGLVGETAKYLAPDLPYNRGLFEPVTLACPEGTIVNSEPPAPVAAAHMDVAFNAAEVGIRCLLMAVAASPESDANRYLTGPTGGSGLAIHTWGGQGLLGHPDGWVMLEGGAVGASGAHDRDGNDLFGWMVGASDVLEFPDTEVVESWYPIRIEHRRRRTGAFGAGRHRSGAGIDMAYRIDGTPLLYGVMVGQRERVPLVGAAGGFPGAVTEFEMVREGSGAERIGSHAQMVPFGPGDVFRFRCSSGGGYGDPLDRDPAEVARDVLLGRLGGDEAAAIYGVVLAETVADVEATSRRRAAMLGDRLRAASPPRRPVADRVPPADARSRPLFPGISQRGDLATSDRTGAVLAVAPDHWTGGCPVLDDIVDTGPGVLARAYLDPGSGHALFVDVVADGVERAFESMPTRWVSAAGSA